MRLRSLPTPHEPESHLSAEGLGNLLSLNITDVVVVVVLVSVVVVVVLVLVVVVLASSVLA